MIKLKSMIKDAVVIEKIILVFCEISLSIKSSYTLYFIIIKFNSIYNLAIVIGNSINITIG